ncbi:MAG TPA: RIP metalloprotease RseP [Candidatus Fimisoma avicola]|uniref:Zinc metalloprotease n=1 Tax=Candidatus Fimisoma avicola TaxID=2840826 RepID=A0A9D1I2H9_9FIRM|nr:RIP metalloprotease RseP [Candidatus Fimisoma avicola]
METAILAIILFCVMIFPHELGHYIAAKRLGVKVNEFAFGMGPVIWKKQKGETLHSIRLFPIGGFCSMEGEDEDSDEPRAFNNKKPWQKIIILAAGSFMNVLCAILIMSIVVGVLGFTTTTIDTVSEGSPAETAGIMAGDEITAIDGQPIEAWTDVSAAIASAEGGQIIMTVQRDGRTLEAAVTPEQTQDGAYLIGITSRVSHNPFRAVAEGAKSTWNITASMFQTLSQLFTGQLGADSLSGPVGMVQMVSQTTQYGWWYYGFLTALICINLAIINMLPLPALDGGRIIFVIISMITGRPVSQKVEGTVHFVGIMLLFGLMAYVTFNDITRIFG